VGLPSRLLVESRAIQPATPEGEHGLAGDVTAVYITHMFLEASQPIWDRLTGEDAFPVCLNDDDAAHARVVVQV